MNLNLIELRMKNSLTQKEVAIMCDISRSFYNQIENGSRKPSVVVAKKISQVLKFDWTLFFN